MLCREFVERLLLDRCVQKKTCGQFVVWFLRQNILFMCLLSCVRMVSTCVTCVTCVRESVEVSDPCFAVFHVLKVFCCVFLCSSV